LLSEYAEKEREREREKGKEEQRKKVETLTFTYYTVNLVKRACMYVALISEAVKTSRRRLGLIKPSHQVTDFIGAVNFSLMMRETK